MPPRVTILGTSHIAQESVNKLKHLFSTDKPDVITVELDPIRANALFTKQKPNYNPMMIRQVGLTGYLFATLGGALQQKLGRYVGVNPGAEMKTALILARDSKTKTYLVDRDIRLTLQRFKTIPVREKLRMLTDVFRRPKAMRIKIDLSRVPAQELIEKLMGQFGKRYPHLYRVLVEERNTHMLKAIKTVLLHHPDEHVAIIVGAGHEKALQEEITKYIRKTWPER